MVSFYAIISDHSVSNRLVVTGYLMTHEWAIYVFDALLMALVLLITSTWYLGHIETLTEAHSEGLGLVHTNTNPPA